MASRAPWLDRAPAGRGSSYQLIVPKRLVFLALVIVPGVCGRGPAYTCTVEGRSGNRAWDRIARSSSPAWASHASF